MESGRSAFTESILSFTLEIIYLLIGEDCTVVKKTSGECVTSSSHGGWSRTRSPFMDPPPHPQIPESSHVQKVLDLTNKIIELLTGEVTIRCQDVTIHFSMDEWEYLEGHKDLYKDAMMEDDQLLTSSEVSSKRNPERCSSSPQSQDCLEGNHRVLQDNQVEDLIDIKVEVIEEEDMYMRGDQQCKKEEIPVNISPGPPVRLEPEEMRRLTERHFMARIPATANGRNPQRRCRVCTKRGRRRDTRYFCPDCPSMPALCLSKCFKIYHTEPCL